MNFISSGEICNRLQISYQTLKRWKDEGRIQVKRLAPKKVLYDIDSILNEPEINDTRLNVIYARVSTTKQKPDLINQIELIKNYMINSGIKPDKVYSEIASGLNDKRVELNKLLSDITEHKIKSIYITFKDRLTRFGFNYFKTFCALHKVEIHVLDEVEESNKDFQLELTEDLISIIHHYSTKLYANRKKKLKQIEQIFLEGLDK